MFKKAILTLMAIFMASSGMPVYAEQASKPEISETDKKLVPETGTASVLGIKNLYAEEPSTLTTGKKFNEAIKTLAAKKSKSIDDWDNLILSVQVVDTRPSDSVTTKDVSANNDGSYLAWWDAGTSTINLYSESGNVILNPDSSSMFRYCMRLFTLDVSSWNTSKVTTMSNMFDSCSRLRALDVSKWDTSHVTNTSYMFRSCVELTPLDVSKWDTSQLTNMSYMFWHCSKLTHLDVSNWDTSQVTDMSEMFDGCWYLAPLDVSNWDTSKVTSMNSMFNYCDSLTTLDLSSWDTSQVTDMGRMFYNCNSLTTIYIGQGWNTDKVTLSDDMFSGCTKLPHFNSSIVDKTNANAGPLGYMSKKPLHYLADTVFNLSGTSDYGNQVSIVVTSDRNGRMPFNNIEKGTYTLTEVSPTDGYIKNSVKYTVTVTDSGVSVIPDNADYYYETADQKVLFNEPYHTFTIQKTSSVDSTVGVAGAEFLLSGVSDYGTEVSQPQITGETGVATFDHLEAGSYLLTETKAPEHFALDPISRIVTINKYGLVKIDGLSKEGSAFVWTDIRNADGTVTITKNWKDTLTGTDAKNRALPSIVISDQRTIPDAVTITYYAGDGYFGTDQTNKTNIVTYTEKVNVDGNISVSVSKGQELTPSMTGKTFEAWYLDYELTNKAPDSIADYIKANPDKNTIELYANYKTMLTTGQKFNAAIKTLAAGSSKKYTDTDSLIQSIQVVDTLPSGISMSKEIEDAISYGYMADVSAGGDHSYLIWWDADTKTVYLYSRSGEVILSPDSSYMFQNCSSLATLDVSGWNTSNVTNMGSMFEGCSSLTTLDVSKWNTAQVGSMYYMFSNCKSLTSLDVANWCTSNVYLTMFMFSGCTGLTSLDLSGWDTSKLVQTGNTAGMFGSCSNLAHIYIGSKWTLDYAVPSVSWNGMAMFYGCTKLPNYIDKPNQCGIERAHAGPGGYMERKS